MDASYDLIVIGAGINGAAIAREAALSRQKVLILDQSDIGSGTSAASTRLIHGGLRYLEYAELSLVWESLAERERLLRLAPHLVRPLGIYLPLYKRGRRRPWQIRVGMGLYDLLSRAKSVPNHRMLSPSELLDELPGLARDGLVGGAHYFDAQVTYPERLIVEIVKDAVTNGAELLTYATVTRLDVEKRSVRGVHWRFRDGSSGHALASTIINAAGPWVDHVLSGITSKRLIGGTKGSHLIVEPFRGAPAAAIYTEAASDGRPFFVIPWNGLYLIGTTDERFDGNPGDATISEQEFAYLVTETERVFPDAAGLAAHVLYTQAGIRPLPYRRRGSAGAITRRHLIRGHRGARGLYSVIGGKLTTHRALAEDVHNELRRRLSDLPRVSPTRNRSLPGALQPADRDALLAEIRTVLGAQQAERLWSIYGAAASGIVAWAQESSELAMAVVEHGPTLVAELVHAIEREWATSLVDILQRRCMAGLDRDFGLATAPAAAQWLVRLGIWDHARAEEEILEYRNYARRFRVGLTTQNRN